jgi:hypothetical protein
MMSSSRVRLNRKLLHPRSFEMVRTASMAECVVRAATSVDMAAVTAIYAHFVETSTATFDLIAPGEATMLRKRQMVLDHGLPYLVAELEGYIVGYSYAAPFRPARAIDSPLKTRSTCAPIVKGTG